MAIRFLANLHPALGIGLALGLGLLAWWLYRRETRGSVGAPLNWLLPTLRALAVALIVITLLEPVIESEKREGEPGQVVFAIDASASMSLVDGQREQRDGQQNEDQQRLQRAHRILTGEGGAIAALRDRFDIQIEHLGEDGTRALLWDSARDEFWTGDLPEESLANGTALGDALKSYSIVEEAGDSQRKETIVVLMSDGQSNQGASPLEAAGGLGANLSIYTIGFGPDAETPDLAMQEVASAGRVYLDDTLVGKVVVAERIPAGRPYRVQVTYQEQLLWEGGFQSELNNAREHLFQFPVQDLIDRIEADNPALEYTSLPIKFDARVLSTDDLIATNNTGSSFTSVVTQKAKLLLIDGRSRWESRYLKNMFTRDPAWEITSVIFHPGRTNGPDSNRLPETREELFDYDLIVLGDVPAAQLPEEFQRQVADFVSLRGGGLLCIDGARGNLWKEGLEILGTLLPVTVSNQASAELFPDGFQLQPTANGESLAALQINESKESSNKQTWAELPALRFAVAVETLPGAEVLLEAKDVSGSGGNLPAMVARKFGAGQVLYFATDETWLWRYEQADKLHTRFWNQLARWTMAKPFSVQNDYISLDTGVPSYQYGEGVELRCQLRDDGQRPQTGQAVTAVVEDARGRVRRFGLPEDPNLPGNYGALTTALPPGDYRVRLEATGFPKEALELESVFSVTEKTSRETETSTCNSSVLKQIAVRSGGEYFTEQQAAELVEALRPRSGGQILLSTTVLWQSYWWFSAAIILLVVEWALRKRAGLI
ncbi:MAG: hypothetical protein AAF483_05055 [Planctomycetota bacterium]